MDPCSGTGPRSTNPNRRRAVPFSNPAPVLGAAREGDERQVELALLREVATLVTARLRLDGLLRQVGTNLIDPAGYRDIGGYVADPGVPAPAAGRSGSATTVRAR